MNALSLFCQQTQEAHSWTNKLLAGIPEDKWFIFPENHSTNIAWQAGHILISLHFHGIMVIRGPQPDLLAQIPMNRYLSLFAFGDHKAMVQQERVSIPDLKSHLQLVQAKTIELIKGLAPEELASELEPTPIPHPIAKNKLEALSWNIKHTMWHCGQIGALKSILDKPYDFKLQRPAYIPPPA
jgi:hypothetical protein